MDECPQSGRGAGPNDRRPVLLEAVRINISSLTFRSNERNNVRDWSLQLRRNKWFTKTYTLDATFVPTVDGEPGCWTATVKIPENAPKAVDYRFRLVRRRWWLNRRYPFSPMFAIVDPSELPVAESRADPVNVLDDSIDDADADAASVMSLDYFLNNHLAAPTPLSPNPLSPTPLSPNPSLRGDNQESDDQSDDQSDYDYRNQFRRDISELTGGDEVQYEETNSDLQQHPSQKKSNPILKVGGAVIGGAGHVVRVPWTAVKGACNLVGRVGGAVVHLTGRGRKCTDAQSVAGDGPRIQDVSDVRSRSLGDSPMRPSPEFHSDQAYPPVIADGFEEF